MSKYNYKEISKGVSNFLKESEGVFTLKYISRDGDKLATDTINGRGEALTFMTSLTDTYREFGTENAYALELTDDEGNVIANAEYPGWEVVETDKLQENDADIDTAEGYIWNDFLSNGEADDYESFSGYTMDISKTDYKKAVKNVEKVYNNISDHIYRSDGKEYLELHDHHTANQLTNEERNPEDWGYFVETAIDSFEEATGVELWQAGRMGRHMIVELNYENAKRYNELVAVCEEMEQIAIEEFNKKEENIEEAEATGNEELKKIIDNFREVERDTDDYTKALVKALNTVSKMEWENKITREEYEEAINEIRGIYSGKRGSLNEEILSEPVKDTVRNTIEKIDDLLDTVKHVVEMDAVSINSMIETINDKTTLNIEEIELDDLYKAIADVKEDLEYALKNSDWSEEEAAEMDESENLAEDSEKETFNTIPNDVKEAIESEVYDDKNIDVKSSTFKGNDFVVEARNELSDGEFTKIVDRIQYHFNNYGIVYDSIEDEDNNVVAYDCKMTAEAYEEYKANSDDYTGDESFTMHNTDTDKTVRVYKDGGKWVDSDGNRYMGYLSKQDVKSYFKGENWIEEAEHTKQTTREIVSEMIGRKISPRAMKLSVGYKWWDWAMQENFVALAEYFGLYDEALKDAISKIDPFENTPTEELTAAEEVIKNATVEIATKLKEHLDSKGATDYKISRVGQYTGQSRMVTFTFYSFKITFLPQTNLEESTNLQDASDDQLKDLCKQEISTGKLTARKLRKVEGINDVIAELKKSGKLQGDEINNNGKYARLTGKGYAKVIDTLSSEQIRDLCAELGYAPNLTESKQVNESEKESLRDAFEDVGSFEELRDTIENLAEEYEDFYDEWLDIADDYEDKCIKYIKKLSKVTTVSPKDEYGYESDYVNSAIKAICSTESLDEKDNSK